MNNSFNGWSRINNSSLEAVVDLVLTNGTTDTIKSDSWLLDDIGDSNKTISVLDFGCGVGRNIFDFSLKRKNWNFYGYDNKNMLDKAKEYLKVKFNKDLESISNLHLSDNWSELKTKKFDCIYATIVFQHIYENDLNLYLKDIKQMTHRLIVSGRRFNDDMIGNKFKNTWQILENNGLYPTNADLINYKVDGDPEEHTYCIYDI